MKKILYFICAFCCLTACHSSQTEYRWSEEKANAWYAAQAWPVGCDYVPAYAGNQIQMWQSETWDAQAIDRELGWAESLGLNSVRIFLHHKVWEAEPEAYFNHLEAFLSIAEKHGISVLMTLFTNGGSEARFVGEKIAPVPGIHNSIWAQTPGISMVNDSSRWHEIETYEKAVLEHFRTDRRILAWCLYNEPENVPECHTLPLLRKVFSWAREVNPIQPLTATIITNPFHCNPKHYVRFPMINFIAENSDIISFHCYDSACVMQDFIHLVQTYNRPVFCTEYLGRPRGSTFEDILPLLKENKIAAYHFGLVHGATQCQYAWNEVVNGEKIPFTEEPEIWFHDILYPDGKPWKESECAFIRKLTGKE